MKNIKNIYNAMIITLALISVIIIVLDFSNIININDYPYNIIDQSIWIIFIFDYFLGILISKNKLNYFKTHIFDLLAIIPVNSLFTVFKLFRFTRVLKITKILRLLRFIGISGKLKNRVIKFLKTNGFIYMFLVVAIILITSAFLFSITEHISFDKSLWWAITTSTTVGYGDVSPETSFGKTIAVVLMLVGISFVGILTSTFTSFFTHEKDDISIPDEIRKYKELLDDGIITKDEFEDKKKQLLRL